MTKQIAVVTGAGAGIGRATVRMLASLGFDIALLGRNEERLADAVAELAEKHVRLLAIPVDVSDAELLRAAAARVESELGPITVWINAAGQAAFGPAISLDAETIQRVTNVTYLGSVYGTQAALECMRRRGTGTIVNLGMSQVLRGLPMQSANVAAHAAITAFCDSLRPEIRRLGDRIDITVVHLPSINTPRLGWSRNRTGHSLKPVGRIYEPEVAANAISHAIFGHHRELWVGAGGVLPSIAAVLAPGLRDRFLARFGFSRQFDKVPLDATSDTLTDSLPGAFAAHGPYEAVPYRDKGRPPLLLTAPLRLGLITGGAILAGLLLRHRR
ncbi:oxidoreductase [Neoasaia chiangmaiensis NBRC 101099]|uniref:Uncharacterized protein n=1 Tax=Neoasaia chiangmaiensis TaxID=320497 RepID=A0A1U9KM10_9PROT|nr:SDR family oxidoreductase [Neoasaia chiangmaiensis]AQS86834.1 hypothetical protein A0U93_01455 [Neoasaia chiangmaiensis]GBR37342.1 oxidoreductase [Neoasaia chiangmaiensis NBRC 101099]GEN14904.1 short-chain dehydrogenase [Neoasaia chiangmaiensis]